MVEAYVRIYKPGKSEQTDFTVLSYNPDDLPLAWSYPRGQFVHKRTVQIRMVVYDACSVCPARSALCVCLLFISFRLSLSSFFSRARTVARGVRSLHFFLNALANVEYG